MRNRIETEEVLQIQVEDGYSTRRHGVVTRLGISPLNRGEISEIVMYFDKQGNVFIRLWDARRNVIEVPLLVDGGMQLNKEIINLVKGVEDR